MYVSHRIIHVIDIQIVMSTMGFGGSRICSLSTLIAVPSNGLTTSQNGYKRLFGCGETSYFSGQHCYTLHLGLSLLSKIKNLPSVDAMYERKLNDIP